MGLIVLGDHQKAAGVLVQPVDDAGARIAAGELLRQLRIPPQQGVDHRSGGIAGGGVNHHSGRLVDHQHGVVLIENREVERLRRGFRGALLRQVDLDPHSGPDGVAGNIDRSAIRPHHALAYQLLQIGARRAGNQPRKTAVEPGAGLLGRDGKFKLFCGHDAENTPAEGRRPE